MKIGNYGTIVHVRFTDNEHKMMGRPSHLRLVASKSIDYLIGFVSSGDIADYKVAYSKANKHYPYSFAFPTSRLGRGIKQFGIEETSLFDDNDAFLVARPPMQATIRRHVHRKHRKERFKLDPVPEQAPDAECQPLDATAMIMAILNLVPPHDRLTVVNAIHKATVKVLHTRA